MSEFVPTPAQAAIIRAGADDRMMVVAGAGSGKTEVLRARIVHLVEEHGLSAGSEILVLSFSRAAVGEMRRRLAGGRDSASFVRCQTFDSYATRLLAEVNPSGLDSCKDFDDRIRCATEYLQSNADVCPLDEIQHILIDEVQDLVGDRASLVLQLLTRANCGFSLFGDPAQSIYGFQLEQSHCKLTSPEFFVALRDTYPDLGEATLNENFRAQSDKAKQVLSLGPIIVNSASSAIDIRDCVMETLSEFHRAPLSVLTPRLKANTTRRIAILCRYNSQALLLSKELRNARVPHRVQARATDRSVATWIALCLADYSVPNMPRPVFEERFESLRENAPFDASVAWRCLRRMSGWDKRSISIERVHNNLLLGNVPDELTAAPDSSLVVSTVHRAKGLEFDEVLVVDPTRWSFSQSDEDYLGDESLEEMRLAYVALTRARDRIVVIDEPDTRCMKCRENPGRRWARRYDTWMTNDIEIRGGDADSQAPAGALVDPSCCPETQRYINEVVRPGDPLILRRRDGKSAEDRQFDLVHQGTAVGASSEEFERDLSIITRANRGGGQAALPLEIRELVVDCVDTVAGFQTISERCGLGRAGIWLRVRPVGLGKLVWKAD